MITIARLAPRSLLLLLSLCLSVLVCPAEPAARPAAADQPGLPAASTPSTATFHPISPGAIDGEIAAATAYLLTNLHYLKKPFDEAVSSQFFDRYLETLDPRHDHFTQGDLAEFARYRTNLNHLTVAGRDPGSARPDYDVFSRYPGDTRPACEIFNRFVERLEQRTAYADELLQHEKFTFDGDERVMVNRKHQPYPANIDEAKKLWRERLRFEYLQELLGKIGARKKNLAAATKSKPPQTETNAVAKSAARLIEGKAGAVDTAPAVLAARAETRRVLALGSPKGGEQKPAMQAAGGEGRTKVEVVAKAQAERTDLGGAKVETRAAPLTTTNCVVPPKKTDDEEIVETLSHRYHRTLRFFTDWNHEDVLQYYLTALAHVYDPHSDYLGRAQLEQFAISMNLSLFGIGAELLAEDGYCKVRRLLPGGPAIKSKLIKENDRIVAVAQGNQPPVDVVEMSLNKAVQLIRGPKGTEVRLTLIPAGADASTRTVVTLIRDEILLEDSAAKAKIIEVPDGREGGTLRLGVIDLPSFYATFEASSSKDKPEPKSTTSDVARLLDKLKQEKVAGVILDLRFNGGGSLEEAIKLTGLFVRTNPVVQVREENHKVQVADDPDPSVGYEGPLVVLTSRHSASASEIVAGALQDYGRALIVGDASTHGKGTVQSVNSLRALVRHTSRTDEPGALKMTIKKFFRPSGASTQLKGVIPDVVLPSVANESKDIGESALENPLPWDTIPSAKYERFNLVEPYVTELRRRSSERIAGDKEFSYIREDVDLFKKHQADKTVSLNEQQRLKEQDENEARQKARDQERLARAEPQQKVYEITLKLAELPGLPPPVARTNAALAKLAAHPVAATNSAAATPSGDSPEETEAEKPPLTDAPLLEAEHILVDYLSLLPRGSLVTARE